MALDTRPLQPAPGAAAAPQVRPRPRDGDGPAALHLAGAERVVLLPDWQAAAAEGAPHLLPLLALWLAREGVPVLVHRPGAAAGAEGATAVLSSLGIAAAHDGADVADRWARREPAWVSSSRLVPASTSPADWRLSRPAGPRGVLPLVACADTGDEAAAAQWAAENDVLVLCLCSPAEADARHGPHLDAWCGGKAQPGLGLAGSGMPLARWAPLPRGATATTAAVFVQDVLSGTRPFPEPLHHLAACVRRALARLDDPLADGPDSCL